MHRFCSRSFGGLLVGSDILDAQISGATAIGASQEQRTLAPRSSFEFYHEKSLRKHGRYGRRTVFPLKTGGNFHVTCQKESLNDWNGFLEFEIQMKVLGLAIVVKLTRMLFGDS